MDVFDKHQVAIAKKTLRLSDIGAAIMGGMNKATARRILIEKAGWTVARLDAFELGDRIADQPEQRLPESST